MTEELNRRHNLATMPTINNNGESYIVPFDIYKEGYDAYDISNWFKGRVGDNGTPFGIRWYKHGQLMDVTGMRPFIEGQVGDYTIDDSDPDDPKINMDSEASNVHVVGDVNDCQEYGVAIYRLINQAMPQSGIFYGKIGVMGTQDDGTTVMSSVDVVFKVLAGHMSMVGARKFYVSELEKALLDFKAKIKKHDQEYADLVKQHNQEFQDQVKKLKDDTQQVIDDARSTYESETKNAHDSLDALKSQIKANRDEQENLAQHLAGTEQQIETHDVVTRPEFLDLGNRLNQQVANLRQNKTLYFANLSELQGKYPAGTDNLCITLDDKHLHVYDYANNQWTDAGATDVITADPATKDAIYQDSSNVAPDPDFKIMEGEWYFGRDIGNADWAFAQGTVFNSKIIEMHGYYSNSTTNNWNNSWCITRDINVIGQSALSIGILVNSKTAGQPEDAHSELQVTFYDSQRQWLSQVTNQIPESHSDGLNLVKWENIQVPNGAVTFTFAIMIHGNGAIKFAQPRINFYATILPYDFVDSERHLKQIDARTNVNNLIYNPDFITDDYWHMANAGSNVTFDIGATGGIQGSNFAKITVPKGQSGSLESAPIYSAHQGYISFATLANKHGSGSASFGINFWDTDNNLLGRFFQNIGNNYDNDYNYQTYKTTNVQVPNNTDHFTFYAYAQDQVELRVCRPQLNYGYTLLPYSMSEELEHVQPINSKSDANNLISNPDFTNLDLWDYDTNGDSANVALTGKAINNSEIVKIVGNDNSTWLTSQKFKVQPKAVLRTSWLLNVQMENPYAAQMTIVFFDSKNTRLPDKQLSIATNTLANELMEYQYSVQVPDQAKTAYIGIIVNGKGSVEIAKPCAEFESVPTNTLLNLTSTKGWDSWSVGKDLGGQVPYTINTDGSITVKGFHSDIKENNWNNTWLARPGFDIKTNDKLISFKWNLSFNLKDQTDGYVHLKIVFSNADGSKIFKTFEKDAVADTQSINNQTITWNGLFIPDGAERFDVSVTIHNEGDFTLNSFDYKFNDDYTVQRLPRLFINNSRDIDENSQNAEFIYFDGKTITDGYMQFSWQGNSSRAYPKKNIKIKLFEDKDMKKKLKMKPKATWSANNKFNLKANWIDATQSRNLVNAKLMADATAITPVADNVNIPLLQAQNLGQMEGYPVEVYLSDGYYGLFTFNTKKNDKTFNMDEDNANHEIVTVEMPTKAFSDPTITIDGKNYATEIHDVANDELKANFTKFVQFVNTSSDSDFKAHIQDYIDLKSVINVMLFGMMSHEYDWYAKSELLATFDNGKHFYMIAYDLDSTWNLMWDGSRITDFTDNVAADTSGNKLMDRIIALFAPEIQKQGIYLRQKVWSNSQMINKFRAYIDQIPSECYKREQERWKNIPSKEITNFVQIQGSIIQLGQAMDNYLNKLGQSTDGK